MKTYVRILDLSGGTIGQPLFDRFISMFPENNLQTPNGTWLRISISADDPRLAIALKELEVAGFVPWRDKRRPKKADEFDLRFEAVYEQQDHESAQLLMPFAPSRAWIAHFETESDGRICFQCENPADVAALEYEVVGLAARADRMLVSSRVKAQLEGTGFEQLVFREVLCREYENPASWPKEPYWELTSDLVLPPLLPAQPPQWDRPQPEERHFRGADLVGIPSFGLALAPDGVSSKRKFLIASKDFYRFFWDSKLEMDWIPVRIDG
jgi:hypothetical protein